MMVEGVEDMKGGEGGSLPSYEYVVTMPHPPLTFNPFLASESAILKEGTLRYSFLRREREPLAAMSLPNLLYRAQPPLFRTHFTLKLYFM